MKTKKELKAILGLSNRFLDMRIDSALKNRNAKKQHVFTDEQVEKIIGSQREFRAELNHENELSRQAKDSLTNL